jgi:Family of unknown function (DUF6011)
MKGATMNESKLETAEAALTFILAGNSTVTLVSKKTGTRFTYRVRVAKSDTDAQSDLYFVGLLRGPNNENDYSYLGRIAKGRVYIGRKVPKPGDVGRDAPSAIAFDYMWQHLERGNIPPLLEIWHEGRCGRCNRKLTVPSSIAAGIGPECALK